MSIINSVNKIIEKECFREKKSKILIAVSGGLDSMCLLHTLQILGLPIGVGTVHYGLRENADVEFHCVQQFCKEKKIPFFYKKLSLQEIQNLKKSNLQEKARTLRYNFFARTMEEQGYDLLATAHHEDDQVENILLALHRSAGLHGLSGMAILQKHLFRPFIHITKNQLRDYARQNNVPYADDESNFSNDYDRNFIRNEVLPLLESRFPSFRKATATSINNIADSHELLQHLIKNQKSTLVKVKDQIVNINISEIRGIPGSRTLLFYLIREYGFNRIQCKEILDAQDTGKQWFTEEYKAVISDNGLLIRENVDLDDSSISIHTLGSFEIKNIGMVTISKVPQFKMTPSPNIEYIDGDKIKWPITLRQWQHGDRMKPIGMKGKSKKIQDLLTDHHIDRHSKGEHLVLEMDGKIIWLVNIRLDERFKVRDSTTDILQLEFQKHRNA